MADASEQFRTHVGLKGSPDPSLGLENAKGKGGGKLVTDADDVESEPLHPTSPERTEVVETEPAKKKAESQKKRTATKKATAKAKKTAKKKSTASTKAAGVKKA